jgi:hypothetical protein
MVVDVRVEVEVEVVDGWMIINVLTGWVTVQAPQFSA